MYDFANTIFSLNVVSLYFGLWVTQDKGGTETQFALALSVSTLLTLVCLPAFGVLSDRYHRRMPFLLIFTALSIGGTAAIGLTSHLGMGLVAFVLAYYGFQVSLVFYDALLPQIAGSPERVGRVAGYGVALGYAGAILGLFLVAPFVKAGGRAASFVPTAALFALFAVPLFLLVRDERPDRIPWRRLPQDLAASGRALWRTATTLHSIPGIGWFLLANFLYSDAVNSVINFMSIYAHQVVGFTDAQMKNFLSLSTVVAVVASFGWGWLTDRIGARTTMVAVLVTWCAGLGLAIASPSAAVFWWVGPVVGAGLGGIWVAGRTLVVRLVPTERLGEFFGLYALTEKATAILGPLIWALVVDHLFHDWGIARYRIAIFSLLLFVVGGLLALLKVPDDPPLATASRRRVSA